MSIEGEVNGATKFGGEGMLLQTDLGIIEEGHRGITYVCVNNLNPHERSR